MKRTMQNHRIVRMRRSLLLKGLFDYINHPTMKWAESREDLEQSFSLVHEEYLRLGFIQEPNSSNMFFNIHNLLPDSATSVIKYGHEVVSTMSIVIDNEHLGLPMDAVYHDKLSSLRENNRKLCEFCALATSRKFRWRNLFMYFFRAIYWHAVNSGMNDICIMVNPRHVPFYKTILLFEDLGPERLYPRLGAPAVALRLNIDAHEEKLREAYKNFEPDCNLYKFIYERQIPSLEDQGSMFSLKEHRPVDVHTVQYFLAKEKNILKKLSPTQRDYMLNIH